MKTIAVTICVWKRLDITRACYVNIESQRPKFKKLGLDLMVYVCGSESDHKSLASEFGYKYIESKNFPVGNKWEKVLKVAMKDKWDFWMTLGSDDFLLDGSEYLIAYQMLCKKVESGMPKNILFFESSSGLGFEFKDVSRCGAARWYSRAILEKAYSKTDKIYPEKDIRLDWWSEQSIFKSTGVLPHRFDETYVADVKSEVNINSFGSVIQDRTKNLHISDFISEFKEK